jgi:hypothetical protein
LYGQGEIEMEYLKVEWIHSSENEPVEILCELDADRNEVRSVERFRSGMLTFAGPDGESGTTILAENPIPSIDLIAADPQFKPVIIGVEEFERAWHSARIATAA